MESLAWAEERMGREEEERRQEEEEEGGMKRQKGREEERRRRRRRVYPCGLQLQHRRRDSRCKGFRIVTRQTRRKKEERRDISLHSGRYSFV